MIQRAGLLTPFLFFIHLYVFVVLSSGVFLHCIYQVQTIIVDRYWFSSTKWYIDTQKITFYPCGGRWWWWGDYGWAVCTRITRILNRTYRYAYRSITKACGCTSWRGAITDNMRQAVLDVYDVIPWPKIVIACGDKAIYGDSRFYATTIATQDILPVDIVIPWNPPRAIDILSYIDKYMFCCITSSSIVS